MATLVTTATIRAYDQLTGPLNAMASRVHAINSRFQSGARQVASAGQRIGVGLGAGAFGLGMLLQKTEDFNKNIFGVGVASLTDAMDATGKINTQVPLDDMERISTASMGLSQKLRMSATTISSIGETLAKAGMKSDKLTEAMEATSTLSKTDFDTPANKMAEFMYTLSIIHKPKTGEGFGDFFRRQADMVLAAAAETQLSVGTIMEGMRQFQTVGAGMGLQTEDMLALIMGGARRGFNATELGTALKSDMVRLLKPTAEGMAALGTLGVNIGDFARAGSQDPTRAVSSLNRATGGLVTGKFAQQLKQSLMKAQSGGYTASDGYVNNVTDAVIRQAKSKGRIYTDEERANLLNSVRNSITTPEGNFDVVGLLKDLVKKGATDTQLTQVFEGRQIARNKAFIEAIRSGEYDQDVQLLKRMKGQGLDGVETLWSSSAFGNLKAMQAAMENILHRLVQAPAIQQFVNDLERAAASLAKVDGKTAALVASGLLLGTIAGPAMMAAKGLWMLGAAGAAGLLGLGRLVALPFAAAATGLRAFALGLGTLGLARVGAAAGGLAAMAGVLGRIARIAAPVALVGAVATLATLDYGKIGQGAGWQELSAAWGNLSTEADKAAKAFLSLFGIDPKGSILYSGIDGLLSLVAKLVGAITAAIELMQGKTKGSAAGAFGGGPANVPSISGGEFGIPDNVPDIGTGTVPKPESNRPSDLQNLPRIGDPLAQPADALRQAAREIEAAAARLQQPPAPVVVGGSGGATGGGPSASSAKAAPPATTNGSNYRGR